ncbi:hypothetical protein HHI36_009748 [Cryptolaemus montrouzieri]|uniref:Uncharacterized protein n=1 Tax=Cryptolaemus montrouzieri TaxID=559131 RepID=A0ABD2MGP2_9CUCU
MVLQGEKSSECELCDPEDADGFTENPSSLEKRTRHNTSESGAFRKYLTKDEFCYQTYRNWATKKNLNIDMWPKQNIFSCHGLSIKLLLTKEEIEEDLALIRAASPKED